jgi:hypothetical protein
VLPFLVPAFGRTRGRLAIIVRRRQGRLTMNKLQCIALATALSIPSTVLGQSLKEQIVGTWKTVSIYNEQGGKKENLYGEKPVGISMFDKSGTYLSWLSKPDLPKFATANRLKGTDAEYKAVMQGMVAGYGTYTVDGDTVTIKWIASSYPNRVGTEEKRTYKVKGDELTTVNPSAASGGISYTKSVRVK